MDDASTLLMELPDDPVLLKRMVVEERAQVIAHKTQIAERETQIISRDSIIDQIKREVAQREAMLEQIKREAAERIEAMEQSHKAAMDAILRRFYGPHSERFDPRQLLLFGITVTSLPIDEMVIEKETGEKVVTRTVRSRHGRGKLPAHLPRVMVEHDLSDEEKKCPCCGELRHRIGQEASEQLEYVPASLKVLEHVRYKYACKQCEERAENPQIEIATKTPQPIEKGLPGPGLLAYVATSKLGDHLPLYRLEHILARQGVDVARSTMCGWMLAMATLVKPLYELMIERVKRSRVIHTDDTRVPVQDEGQCRSGRIWAYIGDRSNPYTVYEYTPDRTRAGPQRFLENFRGHLQADAYGGYDGIYYKGFCVEVACWAHARRKFFDAKESDGRRSAQMLGMVRELYAVEDRAKTMGDEARRELRQRHSVPVLTKMKAWLDAERELVLPRSPIAAAITYTLNQWEALCVYTTAGNLDIDNNAAERAMKRVAIGRKNWLFAGNDRAGQTAAVIYSLIASAEAHGVDPQGYLTSVLAKIATIPRSELDQFLPDIWKKDTAAETVVTPAPSSPNPKIKA